jgi:hypothetical protein
MNLSKIALLIGCAAAARKLFESGRHFDVDRALGGIGLARRHTASERILPVLAYVGLGAAVGAGVALIAAPSSGRELRSRLGERLDEAKHRIQKRREELRGEQYSSSGNGT